MIALDQTRGTLRRAQRTLVCLMLAGVAGLGHAQEGVVKTGSQEGTLVVNYYSTAPDPELEQLRGLAIDAIGVYLRGEMRVEDNDIGWSSSVRNVGKDMERIVRDLMRIRAFAGQEDFKGFSDRETAIRHYTERWVKALENQIRNCPEQYFWVHRRWKTRPPTNGTTSIAQ